jgi:hypothetical protein
MYGCGINFHNNTINAVSLGYVLFCCNIGVTLFYLVYSFQMFLLCDAAVQCMYNTQYMFLYVTVYETHL